LEWIGRSGGGYKEKEMPAILSKLKELETPTSPFVNKVLDTKGARIHWVKPKLVANFEFATWTKGGRIRKPATFLGFRKDKKATTVVREIPKSTEVIEEEVESDSNYSNNSLSKASTAKTDRKPRHKKSLTSEDSNWSVVERIKVRNIEKFELDDCSIDLTDVDRHIWKQIPKASLIQYYHNVAPFILPHLRDRPLSLHLKLNGATAPGVYIKDMEGREPDCATIFTDERRHRKAGKRNQIDYLVCNNEATLLYMVNLGCIDINPWMSRTSNVLEPDFINIDLDPSDNDFTKAIDCALASKEVLRKYKLKGYIKTSGKTGMHIYIPVRGIDYSQARNYSETLGAMIHELVPRVSTTNVSITSRGRKLFIDPSQNDYADTLACAYSVRPHSIPTVSTPLEWKEVKAGLDPSNFTMEAVLKRLEKKRDMFKEVLDEKIAMKNSILLKKVRS
jgi:bifunctional non-homologous end joining protein LigD